MTRPPKIKALFPTKASQSHLFDNRTTTTTYGLHHTHHKLPLRCNNYTIHQNVSLSFHLSFYVSLPKQFCFFRVNIMDLKYSASHCNLSPDVMKHHRGKERDEEYGASSLSLNNLSKLILPPLGVASYNQNQIISSGWVISPMDSRYRYTDIFFLWIVSVKQSNIGYLKKRTLYIFFFA